MSNAANRHAVAVAVNRVLREEKLISVEQTHRSYRRLVSLQVEFEHIDTASALLKLVRLRIATKSSVPNTPTEDRVLANIAVELAAKAEAARIAAIKVQLATRTAEDVAVIEGRKPRAPKKPRAKKGGKSVREELDLANSPCELDRNA